MESWPDIVFRSVESGNQSNNRCDQNLNKIKNILQKYLKLKNWLINIKIISCKKKNIKIIFLIKDISI